MTDQNSRKPAAFRLDPAPAAETRHAASAPKSQVRRPTAIKDVAVITPAAVDVFDADDAVANELDALTPPPALARKSRFSFASLFTGALGILVSLALGLWADNLIRTLFERAPWLGWLALAVAFLAAFALVAIVLREGLALRRLASVQHLREEAAKAAEGNDRRAAKAVVGKLVAIAETLPPTAKGRALLHDLRDEVIDGRDLIRLSETELLRPLDRQARDMILAAAKRVSIVTAVSPRALVDIGYVVFESARLIRRLSELYGGRPGTLGFLRLTRNVIAHLAVTGTVAMGDSIIQQLVGHGLAAKLSARLGEGVINGLMTARIGISAMDLVRPFPFNAERRPNIGDFIGDLARISGTKKE
ncbi:putative membrane protein [Phyllobacterium sp. CL33Tsu]|uniref:YcjF family protein n=1 Tax=Phyllobacterium sp. CL33Tsu TaxID=1798191 RepID=UPI0008EA701E|nr:TIGR01620 family protein [Phyllobacterium sp. CL33Tsu]SFI97523.1 putative membrane protein [Phyllobacterium sp. CL33Tsu]